jgi:uncharacterized protein (TIGR02246 family)
VRNSGLLIVAALLAASLCAAAPQTSGGKSDEQEIRALYDRFAAAFRAKDVESVMQNYAPGGELFVFDFLPPGQRVGFDDYKKYYQEIFADVPGQIDKVEFKELSIVADGNLAYSHAVEHFTVTAGDGSKADINLRVTDGLRKINGKWLITQEHISIPPAAAAQNLEQSRMAAYEASAVASLRVINTACVTYSTIYGIGFPRSLSNLAGSGEPTPKSANLIDNVLASGVKSGYKFTYIPGEEAGGVTAAYTVQADPITPGETGQRHFFTDWSGVIRFNTSRPATESDPPLR